MQILLISGYDALSHQRWRKGLVALFPEIQFDVLSFPACHYKWRSASNGLQALDDPLIKSQKSYDIVLATSAFDLVTLRASKPNLAKKWFVYFHENQFAYPSPNHQPFDFSLALRDLQRARIADGVAFNSAFNMNSFIEGAHQLIKITPTAFKYKVIENVKEKRRVLPVGIEDVWFSENTVVKKGPLKLLWNHRWEYDKRPDLLVDAIEALEDAGVEFELYIAGQRFRTIPDAFEKYANSKPTYLKQFGKIDGKENYRKCVANCDIVLSTADHEFQGLAVLEAVAAGCFPLAPKRLVYPEYLPEECLYSDTNALVSLIKTISRDPHGIRTQGIDVKDYRWSALKEKYWDWFSS